MKAAQLETDTYWSNILRRQITSQNNQATTADMSISVTSDRAINHVTDLIHQAVSDLSQMMLDSGGNNVSNHLVTLNWLMQHNLIFVMWPIWSRYCLHSLPYDPWHRCQQCVDLASSLGYTYHNWKCWLSLGISAKYTYNDMQVSWWHYSRCSDIWTSLLMLCR